MGTRKTIRCARSAVAICTVELLSKGAWPILTSLESTLIHPIYDLPLDTLLVKLDKQIDEAQSLEWKLADGELEYLGLIMSAILWQLDAIVPNSLPSLPGKATIVGSAATLLSVASWYHMSTSKRMALPSYRVSKEAGNLLWQNFSGWLAACQEVKKSWEKGRASNNLDLLLDQATEEVSEDKVYKKLDFKKVWSWIDTQLAEAEDYPAGRRETFKQLFLRGEVDVEAWTCDDIDDLCFAVCECCDMGNDISHFIHKRLNHIRECIVDFYASFTLVTRVTDGDGETSVETAEITKLFGNYDEQVKAMEVLPPAPQRGQFASMGLFLQAQAQYNILTRRFALLHKDKT